jgi:hypothetical protein
MINVRFGVEQQAQMLIFLLLIYIIMLLMMFFFDNITTSFSWTEYGPELDFSAISATCAAGVLSVILTVYSSSYYHEKPNLYLKIEAVDQNSSSIIEEYILNKELLKKNKYIQQVNELLLYIYDDGTAEKKIILD